MKPLQDYEPLLSTLSQTYFTSNTILRNRETLFCEKYICHIYVYKNIFQKKVVDVVQLPL